MRSVPVMRPRDAREDRLQPHNTSAVFALATFETYTFDEPLFST